MCIFVAKIQEIMSLRDFALAKSWQSMKFKNPNILRRRRRIHKESKVNLSLRKIMPFSSLQTLCYFSSLREVDSLESA